MTFYNFAKFIVHGIGRVLWRTRVYGAQNVPRSGPLIIACNHLSVLDPPIVGAFCPRRLTFMAKVELFRIPILGPLIRALGAYPVDRAGNATGAIKRSVEILQSGGAVIIFPEGGRNLAGAARARQGAALLAALTNAPIVPAAIVGSNRARHLGQMKVAFGCPMSLDTNRKATRDDLAKFTDTIMNEIRTLVERVNGDS